MDSAGAFAVRVMVSTLSRAGWIDAASASALADASDVRSVVVRLESERAITPGVARSLLRAAYGNGPQKFGGPESVPSLQGHGADTASAGYDEDPVSGKPLSPVRLPHKASYDEVIAAHAGRAGR